MRTVATFEMPDEANIAFSVLRDAGIEATLRDDHAIQNLWLWSRAVGGVKIDVPDEAYDDAIALLQPPSPAPDLPA